MPPQFPRKSRPLEWPTLLLLAGCYTVWAALTVQGTALTPFLAIPLLSITIAMHSSLQHEVMHGHPFDNQLLSDALVFPAIGLFIPYGRFRALHLAHHHDPILTDPYDDPESNFLDPKIWHQLPEWKRRAFRFNNTMFGRMLLGPAISVAEMYRADIKSLTGGDAKTALHYVLHAAGLVPVIYWLTYFSTVPLYAYVIGAYGGMSLLKIRTFLEHRANDRTAARSVIIEDSGPLSLLFLNNNLHAVHHAHPGTAWYDLPSKYRARKAEFLRHNGGYFYRSYVEIFTAYFLHRKDPIPHPLRDGAITEKQKEKFLA